MKIIENPNGFMEKKNFLQIMENRLKHSTTINKNNNG